jgi:CRISPR/Cas system endoribonuclease Cas6 (RAMP superfamily)
MRFGGLLGSITYEGRFEESLPLLRLGEYIHIGKNTTFGLGRYRLNAKYAQI